MKKLMLLCAVHRREFGLDEDVVCVTCYKRTAAKVEELEAVIQKKNEDIEALELKLGEARVRGKKAK